MKKVICTTTINAPTEALKKFAEMEDWELIVAGDQKTPKHWFIERAIYLNPDDQEKMDKPLSDAIGWNCIQRRNFAFLKARQMGAEIIATVDDDNIPLPGWGQELLVGREVSFLQYLTKQVAFDPVNVAGYSRLWHRGFPLQLLPDRGRVDRLESRKVTCKVQVQADFWNGDPDIDAVCRMEHAPDCTFRDDAFPFGSTKIGPFNSQNTFLTAEVLRDYFMFPHVGRMDDIWPSFRVQALGHRVIWNKASVVQKRNPQCPLRNMKNEYLGYEHNLEILQRLPNDPEAIWEYVPGRTVRAFQLYQKHFV